MSRDDELKGIDHIEALRLLRVGVEMDAAYDPEAQSKLAALDAAIALLTRTEAAPVADGAESVWLFRLAGSDEPWATFHNEKHRVNTMRAPLWEVREFHTNPHDASDD